MGSSSRCEEEAGVISDDASMETSVTESATVGMRVMFARSCGMVVEMGFTSGFLIYM